MKYFHFARILHPLCVLNHLDTITVTLVEKKNSYIGHLITYLVLVWDPSFSTNAKLSENLSVVCGRIRG